MTELTLESLAKRIERLEMQAVRTPQPRRKDWRRAIGMFADSEFMQGVFAESQRIREADREAGRSRVSDEDAA